MAWDEPIFKNPDGKAKNYKIFLDHTAGYGDSKSAGSLGEYRFCDDRGGKTPELVWSKSVE
jgi:hypothetical protein